MKLELMNKRKYYRTIVDGDDAEEVRVDWDEYEYKCPCGKGKVVESIDETPGDREHEIWILCKECQKVYMIDITNGKNNWKIVKKEDNRILMGKEINERDKAWNEFLYKLGSNNSFDKELKDYLCAIKAVSEISVGELNSHENREKINEKLSTIENFINKYKDNYYELSLIKGFKVKEGLDEKDYCYYIADQKMKAAVYYVRYLNFINKNVSKEEEIRKSFNQCVDEVKRKLKEKNKQDEYIDINEENIKDIINYELDRNDENVELFRRCLKCIEELKLTNSDYLKYMLFNNMMREIRYIGGAYQYLWHWETKNRNLFRYVSYEGTDICIENECTKKKFLQDMFTDVINQVNHPTKKLCSYSEDPYVDIFKYLKIKCQYDHEYTNISTSNGNVKVSICNFTNTNETEFEIIKNVEINSIFRDNISKSFYEFAQDGKQLGNDEELAYAVELYPDLPETEKNSKNTTKNIKRLLEEYLGTWSDSRGIMYYVADDKEVVTYGKVAKEVIEVNEYNIPETLYNGYKYKMKMDKDELLYLLLKIRNSDINRIARKVAELVKIEFDYSGEDWIKQVIKGETSENCIIEGRITKEQNKFYSIKCEVRPYTVLGDRKDITIEKGKDNIIKEVTNQIEEDFRNRYRKILEGNYPIAEFILRFIMDEGYKCPLFINEYNEYDPYRINDIEISMLKKIIFKQGI